MDHDPHFGGRGHDDPVAAYQGPQPSLPSSPETTRPGMLEDTVRVKYSEFYRRSAPRLFAYARVLGASREEAADCVQEALVGALENWANLRAPYSWARTVVRRVYFRHLFSIEHVSKDGELDGGSPLIKNADALDELEQRLRWLPFMKCLPEKQRIVMAMTLDRATPAEIAADLGEGVTSEQVRSNLRLARIRLQELLMQAENEQEEGE